MDDKETQIEAKTGKAGMPPAVIDWKLIAELGRIMCTAQEIANVVKISRETLNKHCHNEYGCSLGAWLTQFNDEARKSLRRLQWEQAQKGNIAMLIWLGKQWLGQKEKVEHGSDPNNPIQINFVSMLPGTKNRLPKEEFALDPTKNIFYDPDKVNGK